MRGLERRDDPLQLGQPAERRERLLVGHRLVARAPGVAQPGVLRADAGIVQAGRDRVRLGDLALLVLHDRGVATPCSTPPRPPRPPTVSGAPWRPLGQPVAGGLDADQLDLGVAGERDEHADRVRAAADAGDHARRQPAAALEQLRARLVADHALEVAHERRERRRPDARADRVVRVADVRDPVADRRRDGLLERARAGVDAAHGRAQQPHPLHVGPLAAHVLGAHVDDALQPEQRARGRGRDAVLAGAGLGDDARLAHALGQQALAERVVELVRARVHQVLALEPDRAGRRPPRGAAAW